MITPENKEFLDDFRMKRQCEYCKRWLRFKAEPHHLWCRGMGGGSRLDIPLNLIALGGPWDCACHHNTTNGKPPLRSELLAIVALREHCTSEYIENEIHRLLRTDKHAMLEA